jgi:hypothetical protein
VSPTEALVGMVALWEAMFDEDHRCTCLSMRPAEIVAPGILRITHLEEPPTSECAYCAAKKVLEDGRLAMDEKLIGRG